MLNQIPCDLIKTRLSAYKLFQGCPFTLGSFPGLGVFIILNNLVDIIIDNRNFGFFEIEFGQATFIIDGDCSTIENGILDIVNTDIFAKDGYSIFIFLGGSSLFQMGWRFNLPITRKIIILKFLNVLYPRALAFVA